VQYESKYPARGESQENYVESLDSPFVFVVETISLATVRF